MTSIKPLTIMLDIDDVLNNQSVLWNQYLNDKYGLHVPYEDFRSWEMEENYPMLTTEEIFEPLVTGCLIEKMEPPAYAVEVSERWAAQGHEILVVTATDLRNAWRKADYMRVWFPWFRDKRLILSNEKFRVYGDVLIDDGGHNITDMLQYGANPNCQCLVVDRPWNQYLYEHPATQTHAQRYCRITDLRDADVLIQEVSAAREQELYDDIKKLMAYPPEAPKFMMPLEFLSHQ